MILALWVAVILEGIAILSLMVAYRAVATLGLRAAELIQMLALLESHNWKAFLKWQQTAKADMSELQQRMDMR